MLALCPSVSDGFYQLRVSKKMESLGKSLTDAELEQQWKLAQNYNASLMNGSQEGYGEILNLSDGIMGCICIPKIHVLLPIYHGAGEAVLAKGAGHLPQSGFPVGGKGNHAVITAHSGYPTAKMFSDLNTLSLGDTFEIHILQEVLVYRVDQILVVLPQDTAALQPEEGADYCTLVTCTPYGINSHRLLVRGVRVA